MWTAENRAQYDRGKLRYPSDLRGHRFNHQWLELSTFSFNRLYTLATKSLRKIEDGYHAGQHALARREKRVVVEGPDVTIGSMDGWNTSWW